MPAARQLRSEIQNLIDLLVDKGIAIDANPVVIRRIRDDQRVTWPSTCRLPLTAERFATVRQYTRLLEGRDYSALLLDGALLQLSLDVRGSEVRGHRLCYYPCPVDADEELLQTDPVLDVIELHLSSGTAAIHLRSPLRFDYSARESPAHPQSHLHLLWEHSRCAVYAPLSVGHFVRFVFSAFYPDLWKASEFLQEWPTEEFETVISREHSRGLHLARLP